MPCEPAPWSSKRHHCNESYCIYCQYESIYIPFISSLNTWILHNVNCWLILINSDWSPWPWRLILMLVLQRFDCWSEPMNLDTPFFPGASFLCLVCKTWIKFLVTSFWYQKLVTRELDRVSWALAIGFGNG